MSLSLPGRLTSRRLANGLDVHLLENGDAPVVTSALTYRVGARHEPPGRSGLAHFVEHMMFKGSRHYAAGEIDRRTRALGGTNNAFTTHDTTTYYFSFGAGSWCEALDIEADRMRGLRHSPEEVESERSVILEEIAMREAEPWDALERRVQSRLFGEHPYGRPIVGASADVRRISGSDLTDFHRRWYRPDNAVLVVAGALNAAVLDRIDEGFGSIEPGGAPERESPKPMHPSECARVEISRGRLSRLLLTLPIPEIDHRDFPALRLLSALLAAGRSGCLNDRLVKREALCGWISAAVGEAELGGMLQISAELAPGGEPARVEAIVLEELVRLREGRLDEAARLRARRLLEADWVFAHERIEVQALMLSQAAALVSPEYPSEQLAAVAKLDATKLERAARRYLDPDRGAVLGWSTAEAA